MIERKAQARVVDRARSRHPDRQQHDRDCASANGQYLLQALLIEAFHRAGAVAMALEREHQVLRRQRCDFTAQRRICSMLLGLRMTGRLKPISLTICRLSKPRQPNKPWLYWNGALFL